MKILITGGLGFVGRNLTNFFLSKGHRVTAVGRRSNPETIRHTNFQYVAGDLKRKGAWQDALADIDAVINLCGKSIEGHWTQEYKKEIYNSRILTTRNLVEALPASNGITLCSASAVGYYGHRGDDILNEQESNGNDFLGHTARDWEKEATRAKDKGIRVVVTRFGLVLGKNGGVLKKMIPTFRSFTGGPLGDGRQWVSWIHMTDLMRAMQFVLENQTIQGPLNFCAPKPVRNTEFAKALGKALNRPAAIRAPAFLIRMILGEFGTLMLCSQRMVPEKLLESGFDFQFPDIGEALQGLINR